MKSGELAERLLVSDSLIRKWSDKYARFLSPMAGLPDPGQSREFNDADQLLMASIAHLRDNGKGHEEIIDELESGFRIETLPPIPDDQVEQARAKVALVPVDRLHRALDRIEVMQGEIQRIQQDHQLAISRVEAERDRAIATSAQVVQQNKEQTERIAALREEIAAAKARAEMLAEKEASGHQTTQRLQEADSYIRQLERQIGQLEGTNEQLQQQIADQKQQKGGWFGRK